MLPLTGCTSLPFIENPIDMRIFNHHNESRRISVTALRADEREYSEAEVFSEVYEIPPATDGYENTVDKEDILPSGAYIIQVDLETGSGGQTYQYHFYPDCTGGTDAQGDERVDDGFLIEIEQSGSNVVFSQATCSTNSWKL